MDDDKGLELSLGLPCGGSSSNSKDRSGTSVDATTDTDERTSKIVNDFKNFLNAGFPQSFQRIDPVKPQENFFNNLQQTTVGDNNNNNKRKSMFEEMNNQKKQETESRSSDLQEKGKTSHISITTDEGSTADNEDVAESEAEGSTSRLVVPHHREEGSRTPVRSGSSSQISKEVHGSNQVNNVGGCGTQFNAALSVAYPITIKESPSVSGASTSSYPLTSMMQTISSTTPGGEHPGPRSTTTTTPPGSVPMTFGYSPVQLPALDRLGGVASRLHPSYVARALSTSVQTQVINPPSEPPRPDVHPSSDPSKTQMKQLLITEEGSSSQSEDEAKARANAFPSEYPSIRPGIASEVKFGGSGSFPNLPWVSTTGPGPNGKTISGVTYKYNATQIKIVCACHGTHMSPEEFVRHASDEQPGPIIVTTTSGLASLPSSNPAASAKS